MMNETNSKDIVSCEKKTNEFFTFSEVLGDKNRTDALVEHFCDAFWIVEVNIFNSADNFLSGYCGGLWKYYTTSNESLFLCLDCNDEFQTLIKPQYGTEHIMPTVLACAAICTATYNILSHNYYKNRQIETSAIFSRNYYAMNNFVFSYYDNQYTKEENEKFRAALFDFLD